MLYARYAEKIDASRTVRELGLDDTQPFLPVEEKATLYDLLTAQSGIYLRSHNEEDPGEILMPKRAHTLRERTSSITIGTSTLSGLHSRK